MTTPHIAAPFEVWNKLKGTQVPKSKARQFFKDCFEKYKVWILFKEWPLDSTKYAVGAVSDLNEEFFYSPREKLLTDEGRRFYKHLSENSVVKSTPKKRSSTSEKDLVELLEERLQRLGWIVETDFNLPYGRADIFASQGNRALLVEVKSDNKLNSIFHALGQILAYREQLTNFQVRSLIAIPSAPDSEQFVRSLLGKHDVELTVLGGQQR